MRELSNTLLAQLFAQESSDPFLALFTVSHSSWGGPIYLVNNTEEIVSNGNTFLPFPVRITLPTDDGESSRSVTVEFDNVSRELIDELRSVTDAEIEVTVQLVLASAPDTIEIEIGELKMSNIRYDAQKVTATLTMDDFLNVEMPSESYTPTVFPGIF